MRPLPIASLALLVAVAATAAASQAKPETAPGPTATALPTTTPAPGGTPVTFGSPEKIGAPVPSEPPMPTGSTVPTTSPQGPPGPSFDQRHEIVVTGDYLITPTVHNEFSPGATTGKSSYSLGGAVEFNLANFPAMLGGEDRNYQYRHDASPVTVIGRTGQTFVPASILRDTDADGRFGVKLLEPRVYVAASYLSKTREAGYPMVSGYGLGLQKLSDYESPLSVYFSLFYYPNLTGGYTPLGTTGSLGLTYRMLRYRVGAALAPPGSPVFIDLGVLGDRQTARNSAPSNETHIAPYLGIGFYSH